MDKMPFREFREMFLKVGEIDSLAMATLSGRKQYEHNEEKYFEYVPHRGLSELYNLFCKLSDHRIFGKPDAGFVDIGCGTGRILELARRWGWTKVMGVEFHAPYVEVGKKMYGFSDEELTCRDAFSLSYKDVMDFHIFYMYRPIIDSALMTSLHCHIASKLSWSSIIIEMLPSYYPMNKFSESNINLLKKGEDYFGPVGVTNEH